MKHYVTKTLFVLSLAINMAIVLSFNTILVKGDNADNVASVDAPVTMSETSLADNQFNDLLTIPPTRSIPSSNEIINNYIREISNRYNIEAELIMSIVKHESDYAPQATTGKCVGLMQVSTRWHADRAAKLGVTDFYDPYSNILLGVDYIAELFEQYEDPELVLMLYNMRHDTALRLYSEGKTSHYARSVLTMAESLKKGA